MNEYILKLRSVNLRWLTIITFVATIVLGVILTASTGFLNGSFAVTGVTAIIIYIALTVHAIEDDSKALIVSYIFIAAIIVGLINAFNQFGSYNVGSEEFSNDFSNDIFFGTKNVEEQVAGMLIKSAPIALFSHICSLAAFIYGVFHINKKYMLVWILFLIGYAISAYQAYLLVSGGIMNWESYSNLNSIMGLLSFVAIVALLIVGGKPQLSQESNTVESTPTPTQPETTDQNSLSKKLFQLKELLDSGILTQEEFDAEKKKILNS